MVKLKLKTTQDVYIRKNEPRRRDGNLKGLIYKGQVLEMEVEEIEDNTCEKINGNRKWYKDKNGDFLWSGGFDVVKGSSVQLDSDKVVNYSQSFVQIPGKYRNSEGKGVKVAILDSGIDLNHISLNEAVKGQNISSNSSFGINDKTGHGTHCAGIIGGRNGNIIGIAPHCEIYVSKVITDKGNIFSEDVIKGLKWAIFDIKADVINMSLGVRENMELNQLLEEAKSRNIVIVASAGENDILKEGNSFLYPASSDACIAVGAINDSFLKNYNQDINKKLNLLMPYNDIYSCGIGNEYSYERGSSMSSAFIAGIVSLIKSSSTEPKINFIEIIRILDAMALPINKGLDLTNSLQLIKPL